MGKTTFLINLYHTYQKKIFNKKFNIKLIPLAYHDFDKIINSIDVSEKSKTILLLDAFDEDRKASDNYTSRMNEIISKVWEFRFIIITCRTQFFPFEDLEPNELNIPKYGPEKGYHSFRKVYLSVFSNNDINKYLLKRYSIFQFNKIIRAKKIINTSPDLMVRPMLLSYIEDFIDDDEVYEHSTQVYEALINKWIDRETARKPLIERDEFKEELYKFSEAIAFEFYSNFEKTGFLTIPGSLIHTIAKKYAINLNSLELKSRSLLNRDAQGNYKFAHKSIAEYFLAIKAFNENAFLKQINFKSMLMTLKFFKKLCITHYIIKESFEENQDLVVSVDSNQLSISYYYDDNRKFINKKIVTTDINRHNQFKKNLSLSINQLCFAVGLQNVKCIILSFKIKNPSTDLVLLKVFESLEEFYCNNNKIDSLDYFKYNDKLKRLDLRLNQIFQIKNFPGLLKLEYLNLSNNQLSLINEISHYTSLKHLDLSYNEITTTSPLISMTNLKYLNLKENPLGYNDIIKLKRALPNTKIDILPTFELIINQSKHYPTDDFDSLGSFENTANQIVKKCSKKLTYSEFEVFDKIEVNIFETTKNVIFSGPTLSEFSIVNMELIVNVISVKYGSDDSGKDELRKEEKEDILKNKYWQGRAWLSKKEYVHKICLYTDIDDSKSGLILTIFGLNL